MVWNLSSGGAANAEWYKLQGLNFGLSKDLFFLLSENSEVVGRGIWVCYQLKKITTFLEPKKISIFRSIPFLV